MPDQPTVTFLFTDIEGSTKLWEEHPAAMRLALARHDVLLRQAIEANDGVVFKTVGDAFCAAFATAPEALQAALSAQQTLMVLTTRLGPLCRSILAHFDNRDWPTYGFRSSGLPPPF